MKKLCTAVILLVVVSCSTTSYQDIQIERSLQIIWMDEWGGSPFQGEVQTHEIQYVTLHHGGVAFTPEEDPRMYLRNLQTWSREEKGWIDIPYHYLIDLEGVIYEGRPIRYPGDTNTEYDPSGHALICVLGNYEEVRPNKAQLASIVKTATWLCQTYGLTPEKIASHKDYSNMTACPGKYLYAYLENGYIQSEVTKLMWHQIQVSAEK